MLACFMVNYNNTFMPLQWFALIYSITPKQFCVVPSKDTYQDSALFTGFANVTVFSHSQVFVQYKTFLIVPIQ